MSQGNHSSSSSSSSAVPVHLFFFLAILFMYIGISWCNNFGSILEGLMDQIKLILMVSPLLLLLVLHLLSTLEKWFFIFAVPEQYSIHRGGGTPWGVGLLLVLLLFMISYQSDFRERWFPLLS